MPQDRSHDQLRFVGPKTPDDVLPDHDRQRIVNNRRIRNSLTGRAQGATGWTSGIMVSSRSCARARSGERYEWAGAGKSSSTTPGLDCAREGGKAVVIRMAEARHWRGTKSACSLVSQGQSPRAVLCRSRNFRIL